MKEKGRSANGLTPRPGRRHPRERPEEARFPGILPAPRAGPAGPSGTCKAGQAVPPESTLPCPAVTLALQTSWLRSRSQQGKGECAGPRTGAAWPAGRRARRSPSWGPAGSWRTENRGPTAFIPASAPPWVLLPTFCYRFTTA